MKIRKSTYLFMMAALVGVITFVLPVRGAEWKLHPSFDRTPVRIIDTPEYTYFLVHQQIYQKNWKGYDFPTLTLFRYSKSAPEKGIYPLVRDAALSSADIRMADYSPEGKYLIIVYNDGGIDIFDPDTGEIANFDILKSQTLPGTSIVNSITFDRRDGSVYVAGDSGYLHIDGSAKKMLDYRRVLGGVKWLAPVGDKLVAISDNKVFEISPSSEDLVHIPNISSPLILMPLSETAFAYISGNPRGNNALMLAERNGESWRTTKLCNDTFFGLPDNNTLIHPYEMNMVPNRDGYLLYSNSKVWQLKKDDGNGKPCVHAISRDESVAPLGSWDFQSFWTYRDRGRFVKRHALYSLTGLTNTAAWGDISESLRPDAPAAFIATHMTYSPKYGMLVMNHGLTFEMDAGNNKVNPVLLSGLKNKDWQLYSQTYTTPASVEADESLKKIYSDNIDRFPLPEPAGVSIDPINQDIVSCGSVFGGVMFQDISDLRKDVLRFGSPDDPFKDFPGFVEAVPAKSWRGHSCFSNVSYDNENTAWILYSNAFITDGSQRKAHLKYMTSDVRHDLYRSPVSSLSSLPNMQTIVLPWEGYPYWNCMALACRHELNENLVLAFTGGSSNTTIILDHKGTPDENKDDEIKIFSKVRNNQHLSEIVYLQDVVEDPVNGDIIMAYSDGISIINPRQKVKDGVMESRHLILAGSAESPFNCTQVNKVIFDEYGRMWIGTNNQGVIGVSKDRESIFVRYDTSNSPMPSDCVYGLGWNQDTKSLLISTKLGLAEVLPFSQTECANTTLPYVVPSHVVPGYNGNIEIRNVRPQEVIYIKNKEGLLIRELSNGNSRNIEWDLKDAEGKRVLSGLYFIQVGTDNPIEVAMFE